MYVCFDLDVNKLLPIFMLCYATVSISFILYIFFANKQTYLNIDYFLLKHIMRQAAECIFQQLQ